MSYLVLARKWRPLVWEDMRGQEHVTSTLKNAIKNERLAHAYLFTGPRGVGKTTAARILAKSLNCDKGISTVPCNQCSSCKEISEGINTDVYEIDGASNRGINEIRSLREKIKYVPSSGRYKIYIIDEVHMLTKEAFNALLKTLEEPPEHVVFIFATTEPHKVPPTIISRCQRFDFRRISTQEINQSLRTICQAEKINIDDEAIQLISMKADGSLRDSQSILDQMISYTEGAITGEQVIKALGLIEQDVFFQITDIVQEKDIKKGIQLVEDIVSKGYDIEEFLNGLEDHLRNLLFVISTQNTEILQTSETYKKRYLTQVEKFEEGDILRLIKITSDAKAKLRRDVQPRFQLELAVVKMIKMDKTVTVEDLISQIKDIAVKIPLQTMVSDKNPSEKKNPSQDKTDIKIQEKSAEKVKTEPNSSQSSQPEKKKSLTLELIREQWPEFISRIKHKKITLGSFLAEGILYDLKGKNIEVVFGLDNNFHIDAINRSKNIVSEVLKEVFKQDVYIKCIKKDLPKSEKKKIIGNEKGKNLEDILENDKSLKDLVDDIDAKLIS